MDYMWLKGKWPFIRGGENKDNGMAIIVAKDRDSRVRRAFMVPARGVNSNAVKVVAREIVCRYGLHSVCLKSDQEPAILALKEAVKSEVKGAGVDIHMPQSPVEEHQATGFIENAGRDIQEQVRTIRLALDYRYETKLRAFGPG